MIFTCDRCGQTSDINKKNTIVIVLNDDKFISNVCGTCYYNFKKSNIIKKCMSTKEKNYESLQV